MSTLKAPQNFEVRMVSFGPTGDKLPSEVDLSKVRSSAQYKWENAQFVKGESFDYQKVGKIYRFFKSVLPTGYNEKVYKYICVGYLKADEAEDLIDDIHDYNYGKHDYNYGEV